MSIVFGEYDWLSGQIRCLHMTRTIVTFGAIEEW